MRLVLLLCLLLPACATSTKLCYNPDLGLNARQQELMLECLPSYDKSVCLGLVNTTYVFD